MLPKKRKPTHPGEILLHEFLMPQDFTQVALSNHIGVPVQRINEIVREKRGITPETIWLFSKAFKTTPLFWMNLQNNFDLANNKLERKIKKLEHLHN